MGFIGNLLNRKKEPSLSELLNQLRQMAQQDFAEEAGESIHDAKLRIYREALTEAAEFTAKVCESAEEVYIKALNSDSALPQVYKYVKQCFHDNFEMYKRIAQDTEMEIEYKKGIIRLNAILRLHINHYIEAKKSVRFEDFNRYCNFTVILGPLCLLALLNNDSIYQASVKSLHEYHTHNNCLYAFLREKEYGVFSLNDIDKANINKIEARLNAMEALIVGDMNGGYENLQKSLNHEFLNLLGARMWYYATQENVDQEKMLDAEKKLSMYRFPKGMCLECILAEVFVKNKLGGEQLVLQNLDEIMEATVVENPVYARSLSSFLAWMECFHVELEVLKKTVLFKIELSSEMQERLDFLARGGANNTVKIYEVPLGTRDFQFDMSMENADDKTLSLLFDTLKRKQCQLNYALSLHRWTKNLPLQRGQKVSDEMINVGMQKLMQDFKGEVTYEYVDAAAINLENVRYENCMLFRFLNERSKGLGILFHYEKFGRNLTLYFLTLFLPDSSMGDSALNYARAIASNQYVESMRESVLSVLDEVLTIADDIY